MGMTLSFTRVTPDELAQAFEDPEWALEQVDDEERPDCFLEKAWAGIQHLLNSADVYVELYEDGDPIDEEATLMAWDAAMVAATAKRLSETPFSVLEPHCTPENLNEGKVYPMGTMWDADDLDYLRDHYPALVTFFAETAAAGDAAIRHFSF
nr:hypothetical protein GCM10017745_39280 [Saccharothrix mutabilis subsp. capreolus]